MLGLIGDRCRDFHHFLVRELYASGSRFRRRLLVSLLTPVGNALMLVVAFGERIDSWDLTKAIVAVVVVPAAAIAVGLPAAAVTLAIASIRVGMLNGGRHSLRPIAVAVGVVGGFVLWWNLVGALTFAATGLLEDLDGLVSLLGWVAYFAAFLIAVPVTALGTLISVFHAELSSYGTTDATGRLASIASAAASATAAVVALGIGGQPFVVVVGLIIALAGVTLTYLLRRQSNRLR